MFISKNKKGMTWEQLVLAIIAIVVVVLVIIWFKSGGEKGFGFASEKTDELKAGDTDGDGVPNIIDACNGAKDSQINLKVDAKGCEIKSSP